MKYTIIFLLSLCLPVFAGIQFEAKITSQENGMSETTGYVDGQKAKMDFRQGVPSAGGVAGYLITQDGGRTIYLIDPETRTYMRFDPAQMADAAGTMMQMAQGFMSVEIKDPSVEKKFDRKGPDLLGYATRHIMLHTAYTMETSVLGRRSVEKIEQQDEMWVTGDLKDPGLSLWMQQSSIRTGNEGLDRLIELEQSRINGFPLKVISTRTETQGNRAPQTEVTEYEITSIRQRSLPAAIFEIPEGYTDALAEAAESLREASQALDKEKQSDDSDAQGAVDAIMRGIFGGGR